MANAPSVRIQIIKKALEHNLDNFTAVRFPTEVIHKVVSKAVLTWPEKEELDCKLDRKGPTAQVDLLLMFVMRKEKLEQLEGFLDVIRGAQPHLYTAVTSTIKRIEERGIPLYDFCVEAVTGRLREVYSKRSWSTVEPIPGVDDFFVDLNNQETLMAPSFDVQKIQVYKKPKSSSDVVCLKYESCCIPSEKVGKLDYVLEFVRTSTVPEIDTSSIYQPHLLEITGIAGAGKTTSMKNMVWKWSKQVSVQLQKFELVFMIPVSSTRHSKIIDILSEDGFGFCANKDKDALHYYLMDTANASRCLFILDGIDERTCSEGSEMYLLIRGELYHGATVIITARQEAQTRKCLAYIKPMVKVTLKGTDEASVDRFMSASVKGHGSYDLLSLKVKLKKKLNDFSLLFIPLYLTLISFVLNERDAQLIVFSDAEVPQTMTALFNTFLCVIVRRWLKRIGRTDMNVSFTTSPLDKNSSVPADIKRTLLAMGNICYNGLMQEKYEFTSDDVKDYLLDMQDIQDSGLFHVAKASRRFFTKHKQLQEYLAALYLSHAGMENKSFSSILCPKQSPKPTLYGIMRQCNLLNAVQFSCGLCPDFFATLFKSAENNCSIANTCNGYCDIAFEAMLYKERSTNGSCESASALKEFLLHAETHLNERSDDTHDTGLLVDEKCLEDAIACFSVQEVCQLLQRFYDVELLASVLPHQFSEPLALAAAVPQRTIKPPLMTFVKLSLDQLQVQLLKKLVAVDVQEVTVDNEEKKTYVDLLSLTKSFPGLTKMIIKGHLHCAAEMNKTVPATGLRELLLHHIERVNGHPSPPISFIFRQMQLEQLSLENINILSIAAASDLTPKWKKLKKLSLIDNQHIHNGEIVGLTKMLSVCQSTLEDLTLSFNMEPDQDVSTLNAGLSALQQLSRMYLSLGKKSKLTVPVLIQILPSMSSLTHLGIVEREISNTQEEPLVKAVCSSNKLVSICLWINFYAESSSMSFSAVDGKLKTCGINVERKSC